MNEQMYSKTCNKINTLYILHTQVLSFITL